MGVGSVWADAVNAVLQAVRASQCAETVTVKFDRPTPGFPEPRQIPPSRRSLNTGPVCTDGFSTPSPATFLFLRFPLPPTLPPSETSRRDASAELHAKGKGFVSGQRTGRGVEGGRKGPRRRRTLCSGRGRFRPFLPSLSFTPRLSPATGDTVRAAHSPAGLGSPGSSTSAGTHSPLTGPEKTS